MFMSDIAALAHIVPVAIRLSSCAHVQSCVIDDAIQHTPWRVQHALRVQHFLPNGLGLYGGRTLLASVAQRGIHFVLGGQG